MGQTLETRDDREETPKHTKGLEGFSRRLKLSLSPKTLNRECGGDI
jgi:hypothetical protein